MDKDNKGKVSIVLPVYNGEKYLAQSIESVLNQTYTNIELIIVNDCSTDSSEKIIEKYKELDSRVVYLKNQVNLKLPRSLNEGFRKAKGKYYTWTSDDNIYHKDAIEKMVDFLENNEDVSLVYCSENLIDENGNSIDRVIVSEPKKILYGNNIGACFMYRSSVAKEIGEYSADWFLAEDYEYWLRIYLNHKIKPLQEILYDYRFHEKSLTATRKEEIRIVDKKLKWSYLNKFEKTDVSKKELFDYFQYLLSLEDDIKVRIFSMISFSFRHISYVPVMVKKTFIKVFK